MWAEDISPAQIYYVCLLLSPLSFLVYSLLYLSPTAYFCLLVCFPLAFLPVFYFLSLLIFYHIILSLLDFQFHCGPFKISELLELKLMSRVSKKMKTNSIFQLFMCLFLFFLNLFFIVKMYIELNQGSSIISHLTTFLTRAKSRLKKDFSIEMLIDFIMVYTSTVTKLKLGNKSKLSAFCSWEVQTEN